MLNKDAAREIIAQITAQTKNYAQVRLSASEQGTTRFAKSEISQNVSVADATASLTMFNGKKEATASTNDLTPAGLAQLAKDADALLAHVPDGTHEAFPFPQGVDSAPPATPLAQAFDVSERAALIKKGMSYVENGFSASGALVLTRQALALGDSRNAFHYAAYDNVTFNTVVTSSCGADGAGECASYTDTPDIIAQFKKAQATAKNARNPVAPELGAHTVVLSPVAFGDLMYFLSMMLNAKAVDDGISFAAGKLGQQVFGTNLTVRDDITHPHLRPLPFDLEGNPRKPLTLIENGVLTHLLYDNKRAAKHGKTPTGHAVPTPPGGAYPFNLVVDAGDTPLADLISGTQRGIFINEFHYTNFVNPRNLQITGLTRNGTFLIENGKLTRPISTVRFTESLLDAFNHITALSSEREKVTGLGIALMPAAKIENFHFTSKA